ncbi:MAG: hypothetical protein L0Z48_07865, partial [candidate division Zixibacteria bacterium]|nr:hypothetical protein [candidate division Zixibacteria bacterium]MCI0596446.1 hypothetical protein [candidate division Zixibacteria bacterium]
MANSKLIIKKTGNNKWEVVAQNGTGELNLEVEDTTTGSGNTRKPKSVKVAFGSNDQTIIVDP